MILTADRDEDSGILRLTLNEPGKRNALSREMIAALSNAIDTAAVDATVKVIILAGNGPAFCAGHDLRELTAHRSDADRGAGFFAMLMRECSAMMMKILHCPKPIIAEVNGIATAAGCQLVASCDLALASEHAKFATPGVNLGLFCSTPMVAVSRNLSRKHTMEMLLTGEMLPAARAAELGLINRVVPEDDLVDATLELATRVASRSATAIKIGKEAYYRQLDMEIEQAYAYVSEVMVTNMLEADAEEGINAFLEKRDPNWL